MVLNRWIKLYNVCTSGMTTFSNAQKISAVLRVLKGESVDSISQELGVSVRRLESWHSAFVAAGTSALERKRGASENWWSKNSRTVLQWLALLAALLITVAMLVRFFQPGPRE